MAFRWQLVLLVGSLVGIPARPPAAARPDTPVSMPKYTFTDLGVGPGGFESHAIAVNGSGEVIGRVDFADAESVIRGHEAFVWADGRMRLLSDGLRHSTFTDAAAINDRGEIVGTSVVAGETLTGLNAGSARSVAHPILWKSDGTVVDISGVWEQRLQKEPGRTPQPAPTYSTGLSINDRGDVLGMAYSPPGGGFLVRGDGVDLLRAGLVPAALNNRGQVAGTRPTGRRAASGYDIRHACLWDHGTVKDLGSLPGYPDADATAINGRGQVVGRAWLRIPYSTGKGPRAFVWTEGKMRDLGALPGSTESSAGAIDDRGDIVGYSTAPMESAGRKSSIHRAVLWRRGRILDLNSLVPAATSAILLEATGVNDRGQIAGNCWVDGRIHAFLLTPAEGK